MFIVGRARSHTMKTSILANRFMRRTLPCQSLLIRKFTSCCVFEQTNPIIPVHNFRETYKRSHYCGDIISDDFVGRDVKFNAWVEKVRTINKENLVFVVLRDRTGTVQAIIDPSDPNIDKTTEVVNNLSVESVVTLTGIVRRRPTDQVNKAMITGDYEVVIREITVLNECSALPLQLASAGEEIRLKYRYLDLRRPELLNNLKIRSKMLKVIKEYMSESRRGFLEIETPTLFKSTPEGAREYIVPTRQKGKFYALTQSPQQYKQLLMVGGIDRYYQIARCYRDESGRMDRQPEFTQVDIEMSFITPQDIYELIEGLLVKLWKEILNHDIKAPFKHMSYHEAMTRFGSDKPDTRFGLEFKDITNTLKSNQGIKKISDSNFTFAFNAKQLGPHLSKKKLDDLKTEIRSDYINTELYLLKYPCNKFDLSENDALKHQLDLQEGDIIVLCTGMRWDHVLNSLGKARLTVCKHMVQLELIEAPPRDQFNFLWVVDFPLFETVDDGHAGISVGKEGLASMHHPFTAPLLEDAHKLTSDPLGVRGMHYDIVLNGMELGGGSIRIHNPEIQRYVLEELLGLGRERTNERFSHLLEALSYGAPPHGGIALGFDRVVSVLCGEHAKSLRDVIAFPKSASGNEVMSGSPGPVESSQLKELFIDISK
ncbi:aspartyl tRS [Acrasis kona]|uniref:Aspartyl tRS n=1 Tax=Acrasis kona TaxID=1008807 RepID=A0AAW2Z491_9EUKA